MDNYFHNKKNKCKTSFYMIIFSLSLFFVFFSLEVTFLVRSIIPPVILAIFYIITHRRTIKINTPVKYFIALESVYLFSSIFNIIKYNCPSSILIQMAYQLIIFIWFFCLTQGEPYSKYDLNFYMDSYIIVSFLCSIYTLYGSIILKQYTPGITGFFGYEMEKNFFGAFLCLGPIYSALKALYGKKKIRYIIATIVISVAVLLTNSRGAMLALVTSAILLFLDYFFMVKKISRKRLLITIICAAVFIICLKPLLDLVPDWMLKRYFINSYNDKNNLDRILRWKNAIKGILEQPLFGFGPGVFSAIPQYQVTEMGKVINNATYAHNTYLDVMVNGGIVGVFLFMQIIISCVKNIIRHNIFRPILLSMIITSGILGAGKSVYFWNTLIFLEMISVYLKNNQSDIKIFN